MGAGLIDGAAVAREIRAEVAESAAELIARGERALAALEEGLGGYAIR